MMRTRRRHLVTAACGMLGTLLAGALLAEPATLCAESPPVVFEDASARIPFHHQSIPFEGDGLAGAAWLDYDADGYLDLFLPNGPGQANALFHNDGHGGFIDVAAAAGVENRRGNSGVVAADFDNDGFPDLFLTGDGGITGSGINDVVFYHNNGDGTFSDLTAASHLVGPPTAVSAAAADVDNDGFLDLFIAAPGSLATQVQHANRLFRNNGDLTFTDISHAAGVDTALGGFAALFSDSDGDGWLDLFVGNGNDVHLAPTPNELFRNHGDLTFGDRAAQAGLAAGGYWMGFGAADYDGDGQLDVFVTNFGANVGFPHALYRNNGDGTYTDVGHAAGAADYAFAWGCAFTDFDDDGTPDLYFAGALPALEANPGTLLFNAGHGTFRDFTASSPVDLHGMFPSGIATGDYDDDGFADLVVMREPYGRDQSGQPVLLHNRGNANQWATLRLVGTHGNRGAVGARVWVTAGGRTQVREVYAGSSFASTDSPWLTFGLGSATRIERVRVRWPRGGEEVFRTVPVGRSTTLVEGSADADTPGDCDRDGAVSVAELVRSVAIALGLTPLAECGPVDANGDGQVAVGELVLAVRAALAANG